VNTLGNSLWYQDTPNSILAASLQASTIPADLAAFALLVDPSQMAVDRRVFIAGIGSFSPKIVLQGLNGTYAAPTKSLAGDVGGQIRFHGWTGAGVLFSAQIDSKALTDYDAATPVSLLQIEARGSLDQVTIGYGNGPPSNLTSAYVFGKQLQPNTSDTMAIGYNINFSAPITPMVAIGVSGTPELQISSGLVKIAGSAAIGTAGGLTVDSAGSITNIGPNISRTGNVDIVPSGTLGLGGIGAVRWRVTTNGELQPAANNTYDFGDAATMVRTLYLGTSLVLGGSTPTAITNVRVYAPNLTPAGLAAAIGATEQFFNVPGLTTADKVFVNGPAPTALCPPTNFPRVSAPDTLAITFVDLTVALCTPAAGVYPVVAVRS
jgi:hypothetical protein